MFVPSLGELTSSTDTPYSSIWKPGYSNETFSYDRVIANGISILYKKNGSSLVNDFKVPNSTRSNHKMTVAFSDSQMTNFLGNSSVIFYSADKMEITSNIVNDAANEARMFIIVSDR